MATKSKTTSTRSGAAKTATRSTTAERTTGSDEPRTNEAQAAADAEKREGKTVTSVSSGPMAIPTAEVAGAGADRAAARAALREQDGVIKNGPGLTNQDAGLKGTQSIEKFLESAAIGTTVSKTGAGITISSPIGGGATRTFAGATLSGAVEEMDEFFSGSPRMMSQPGPQDEKGKDSK